MLASRIPITAADDVVPSERIKELKPLAAAFCCAGTPPRIRAGMAPKASPVPQPAIAADADRRMSVQTTGPSVCPGVLFPAVARISAGKP